MSDSTPLPGPASAALKKPPDAAERLRRLWLQGQCPKVDEFLAHFRPLSPAQIAAVLRVDQGHRWHTGDRIPAETYLLQHPVVAAHADSALDVIYGEYLLRERNGEHGTLPGFLARFPEHAGALRMQVELHEAIALGCASQDGADCRPTLAAAPGHLGAATPNGGPGEKATACAGKPALPILDGYEILAEVGRGGMGVIYKARQVGLNRFVALKMIPAGGLAGPAELARFRTEAEAVASLRHPHVVQIYEVGVRNGLSYLALEFVDGGNLAARLAGKPLAPRHGAELVEILARAVQAAHDQGIIHRDLKPANVLLASPAASGIDDSSQRTRHRAVIELLGIPKITDFGLAKCLLDDRGQTTTGAILGTASYMAPEQAEGRTRDIGPAIDIYALGAILYEALTGQPPFVGATLFETLDKVRSQEPVSPSQLQPSLPRDLVTICLKALAKEPGRRYASAGALADDLRRFQDDVPVHARPVTLWERGWRWCRRNPVVAGLSASLTLLVVVLVLGFWVGGLIRTERDQALANLERARKAETEAQDAKKEIQIRSHVARADALHRSGQVGQRFKSLAELKAALRLHPPPELRREIRDAAISALVRPDLEVAHEWDGWPEGTVDLAFDASMRRYARLDRDGAVTVYRLTDAGAEEVARVPPQPPWPTLLRMSPDGRYVLFTHAVSRTARTPITVVWRVDSSTPRRVLKATVNVSRYAVAFHPRVPLVAIGAVDSSVRLYHLDTGRERRLPLPTPPQHLAFSSDGAELAVAAGKDVAVLHLATGEVRRLSHGDGITSISHAAWHPDGRRLATACNDLKIHVWDVKTGKEVMAPWPGHANQGIQMAFAGDRLISRDMFRQVRLWDAVNGRILLTMSGNCGIQTSADGSLFGYQRHGGRVQLWRVAPGDELRAIRALASDGNWGIYTPVVHPDGRLLGATSIKRLRFYDLHSGAELVSIPVPHTDYTYLRCYLGPAGWVMTSPLGAFSWPVQPRPGRPGTLQIGPPRQLETTGVKGVSASPDGRVLVVAHGDGAFVRYRDGTNRRFFLGPQRDVRHTAVSPDKRWVVTCSWEEDQRSDVQVWDAATGRHVRDLAKGNMAGAWFSPDSRWLITVTTADGSRLWDVKTWREVRRYKEAMVAFHPDRRLLALTDLLGQIRLVETATNREVARLTGPEPLWWDGGCFAPDGDRLVTVSLDRQTLYIWNLRLIRQGLKAMGLDWEADELPPAPAPRQPPELRVDPGFMRPYTDFPDPRHAVAAYSLALALQPVNPEASFQRGFAHERLGQAQPALADYSHFLTLAPATDTRRVEVLFRRSALALKLGRPAAELDDLLQMAALDLRHMFRPLFVAERCNQIAWGRAAQPETTSSLEQGLILIQMAMRLEPDSVMYRNTLGVLYYRLGRYREAVASLQENLGNNTNQAAFDLYFLAMAYQRLNEPAKARDAFTRAVQWHESREKTKQLSEPYRVELRVFRAEAQAVMK